MSVCSLQSDYVQISIITNLKGSLSSENPPELVISPSSEGSASDPPIHIVSPFIQESRFCMNCILWLFYLLGNNKQTTPSTFYTVSLFERMLIKNNFSKFWLSTNPFCAKALTRYFIDLKVISMICFRKLCSLFEWIALINNFPENKSA